MASAILDQHGLTDYLGRGTVVSFVLHVLLVTLLVLSGSLQSSPAPDPEPVLMVSFVPPKRSAANEPPAPRQIVTQPERSDTLASANARFLSERDTSAEKEMIKRGDDPEAGAALGKSAQAKPSEASQPRSGAKALSTERNTAQTQPNAAPKQSPKEISSLQLDRTTMLERFTIPEIESTEDRLQAALSGSSGGSAPHGSLADAQPFARAAGSGARILGSAGSSDYLPSLPDGDITMLNTKANVFAVFVRRVAVQVFGHLRSSGWERLRAEDIQSMSRDTTVRAVLSPQGNLLKVELESGSGSTRFDEVLSGAVRAGARDPNPPKAAALEDGNIHFVFKARSWVRYGADPRTGAPGERRWLILGTGLD